ncbi:MAG: DNA-3-methyladenine glycosylase [Nitrosomonadales bacterium]|nr:DNA-3-methyladenine glycosylase [Nitrosomonadales bacterium]|tara:strand:- start:385 stop:1017 length:633 start_codon:yes stop_codon:yes gene_type:complete
MQENLLIGNKQKYEEASDFLSKIDSDWKNLVKRKGPCDIKISNNLEPYQSLIKSVIFQQLHPKAGNAILKRFLEIFDNQFPLDAYILKESPIKIKSCGLSKNKLSTILLIASMNINKKLPTSKEITKMTDNEIIKLFSSIKGIGEWTVQMILIFNLGRLDIIPQNDLAIRKNYQKFKQLNTIISPKDIIDISKVWRPYRSIASWYLWHLE